MGSNQAMNGLGGGMAVLGGLTFFGAMVMRMIRVWPVVMNLVLLKGWEIVVL